MAKTQPVISRTPIAEWIAAGLGLALTLGVIVYSVREGVSVRDSHPRLTVEAEAAEAAGANHVVPVIVRNAAHATAASVEVRGVLRKGDAIVEERRVVIAYVPGKGEARGGLLFERDPAAYALSVTPEGYEEP